MTSAANAPWLDHVLTSPLPCVLLLPLPACSLAGAQPPEAFQEAVELALKQAGSSGGAAGAGTACGPGTGCA